MFEYDAQGEALVRVSRGEGGYNEDGNSGDFPAAIPIQFRSSTPEDRFRHLAISEDGSMVFFSSADALTPLALNQVCIRKEEGVCVSYADNIYEYHDEHVSLISDGHDDVSVEEGPVSELLGTDESGRDVFFTTADNLVPQDGDTQVDIYDAREDGGFAPVQEPAPCSGDSCRGVSSPPPSLPAPVTSMVAGEPLGPVHGTAAPGKSGAKPNKHRAKKKRRHERHRGKGRGSKSSAKGRG